MIALKIHWEIHFNKAKLNKNSHKNGNSDYHNRGSWQVNPS